MGRPRRHQDPEKYHLITNRTLQGMFLLLPDDEAKRIILACLAKFVAEHNVQLVCAAFLFNHFHLIARFPDSNMAAFMRDFQRELASRINTHRDDRRAPVFPDRYDDKILVDSDALSDSISYVINNPVRHGLVGNSRAWPGIIIGTDALSGETELTGQWLDANRWYNLSRRKSEHDRSEAMVDIPLEVHLPEELPGEDENERLELLRAKISEHRQYFRMGKRQDGGFPTSEQLMGAHWSDTRPQPESTSKRFGKRRARCAAGTVSAFLTYERQLRRFDTQYETARLDWKSGKSATFPVGSFPPGRAKCVTESHALPPPG